MNYKDFLTAADKSGMIREFKPDELDRAQKHPEYGMGMLSIKRDYKTADNSRQKLLLDEAANQLKTTFSDPPTKDGFHYSQENAYKDLLDQTLNHGAFEYDIDKDPRWHSYRKSYGREGERAQENAITRASAMTGGRPSSYAVTAAAQAGNYYAGKLNDIIPELYGQARKEYDADFAQKLQQLQAMKQDKADEYNIYIDSLNEAFRQQQAAQAAAQQKFQNAMALYRQFGYAPNQEVADILGVPYGAPQSRGGGGYYGGYSVPVKAPKKEEIKNKNKKPSGHGKSPVYRDNGSFSKYGNTTVSKW